MAWGSNKKQPGYSYFGAGVTLEGRLCFSGVIRLDGRVNGEIISNGTLVVEETSIITGNILVESIILSGTVYGNIQASKQVQLNASAKVYGHIGYGELSIEGAIHEGSSHKLTADEIELVKRECLEIMDEASANAELCRPDSDLLEQYAVSLNAAERQAAAILYSRKAESPAARKSAKTAPAIPAKTTENGGAPAKANGGESPAAKGGEAAPKSGEAKTGEIKNEAPARNPEPVKEMPPPAKSADKAAPEPGGKADKK